VSLRAEHLTLCSRFAAPTRFPHLTLDPIYFAILYLIFRFSPRLVSEIVKIIFGRPKTPRFDLRLSLSRPERRIQS
jgi:hypothetical protein